MNLGQIKACDLLFCYDENKNLVICDKQKEHLGMFFPSFIVDEKIVSFEMRRLKYNSCKDINFTEAFKTIANIILQEKISEKVINKEVKIRKNIYEVEAIIKQASPQHFHVIIDFICIR